MAAFHYPVNWAQLQEELGLSDEAVVLLTERDHAIEDYLNDISTQISHASVLKFGS